MKLGIKLFIILSIILAMLAGCSGESMLDEAAALEKLQAYMVKTVKVKSVSHQADPSWVGSEGTVNELPPIENYPFSVRGNATVDVEIFCSTEKAAKFDSLSKSFGPDGWIEKMAREFNAAGQEVNGSKVSVSIRPISSGLALDYIITRSYVPAAYTPSNEFWGEMISESGLKADIVTKRLLGNTAGILMEKGIYKSYMEKYATVSMENLIEAVFHGDVVLGHTDPNVSSTGLNIFTRELLAMDRQNPFSSYAIERYREYQKLIPPVSPTTGELIKVAEKGILSAMIMSPQEWADRPTLADWVFTPIGVRQDSPLYALDGANPQQIAALRLFADHCVTAKSQEIATGMNFNQFDSFMGEEIALNGRQLFEGLKIWKRNKDGGDPVISVFVVDTSGSMDNPGRSGKGKRIDNAKTAMLNSLQYINEDNYLGLLSYSSANNICIDAPIARFDASQRSLFAGAINDLKASGNTATNSAIVAALDMAVKAKKELNLTNAKIRILVFTDGATNQDPLSLAKIEGMIHGLGVPVYGVFFEPERESDMNDLDKLSAINEGYKIVADTDDVISQLKSLFIRTL